TRQHQHVDVGHLGKAQDGVGAPFAGHDRGAVEGDLFHQGAAGRLDHIALDLMPHAVRINHQSGVLPRNDTRDADIAGRLVDGDVGDPGRPRCAIAGKLAVDIERIGEAASTHDVAFAFLYLAHRPRCPACTLGDRVDEIDGARVFQVAQAICDRVDAGFGCELVD